MRKMPIIRRQESFFGLSRSSTTRDLVVVGVPWDATSSYRRGASAGPDATRWATSSRLYNHFTEQGMDLSTTWHVCDHGNVRKSTVSNLRENIAQVADLHNHRNPSILFIGGDHFVTYPCFDFVRERSGNPLSLLYFDAHPDLYERYEGNRDSHATVVSRILETRGRGSGKVCYVGIRASTREQDERISALGLTAHTARDVYEQGCEAVSSSIRSVLKDVPVYLSFDLDCLDPAHAPGVPNPQPGGLTTRQVFQILHRIAGLRIVAADVVEYAPEFDSGARTTAFTSAALIKEIMGVMAQSR